MNAVTRHWSAVRDALDNERVRSRSVLRTEETDFLPAALEVVERPVSPTARATAWVLLGLLVVALLWLFPAGSTSSPRRRASWSPPTTSS